MAETAETGGSVLSSSVVEWSHVGGGITIRRAPHEQQQVGNKGTLFKYYFSSEDFLYVSNVSQVTELAIIGLGLDSNAIHTLLNECLCCDGDMRQLGLPVGGGQSVKSWALVDLQDD